MSGENESKRPAEDPPHPPTGRTGVSDPPARSGGQRHRWILAALAVGAALFQLVMLLAILDIKPRADELQYLYLAREILTGGGLEGSLRPPVYPYLVAAGRSLAGPFGNPRLAIGLVQIAVSTLSMLLLYALTRDLFGRRAGVAAAAMFGFYPTIAAHTHLLWSDSIMLAPILGSLWLASRAWRDRSLGLAFAAGLCFGVGSLTREFLFWFIPVAALWLFLALGRSGEPPLRRALAAGLLVVAALVVILPWTARNHRLHGEFILISANSWSPFFLENNDHPVWRSRWKLVDFYREYRGRDIERERFAREHGLAYVADRMPGWLFERIQVGVPELLSLQAFPLRHLRIGWYGEFSTGTRRAATLAVALATLALYATFAFALAATRWDPPRLLLLLFVGYAASVVMPFPVVTRYRLPIEAVAMVFAAAFLVRSDATRGRLATPAALAAAVVLAFTLGAFSLVAGLEPLLTLWRGE